MASDFADISILPQTLGLTADTLDERARRELLMAKAGGRLIGIFADEADGVTEWKPLTPLPRAPAAVLGVVCVRGRMLTVLDPLALLGERRASEEEERAATPCFIIALRGDEQLALAVDRAERIIEIFSDEVEPLNQTGSAALVRGILQRERELIAILNPQEIFAAALQGLDRRRQR
jgi:purine-binding chemotaxis protein CheW